MRNVAIIVAAIIVLAGGFLIAKSDSEESREASAAPTAPQAPSAVAPGATASGETPPSAPEPEPATPEIPVVRVVDGKPQGGVQELKFGKGDRIRFTVASDVADEIHVHGFDLYEDVPAGGRVSFDFTANADGRYEVELHEAAVPIAELQIAP